MKLALAVGLGAACLVCLGLAYWEGFGWLLGDEEGPASQYLVNGALWVLAAAVSAFVAVKLLGTERSGPRTREERQERAGWVLFAVCLPLVALALLMAWALSDAG